MLDVVRHPTHLVRTLVRRALVKPAQFRWGGERQGERGDVSGREDGTIRNVEEKKYCILIWIFLLTATIQ